MKATRQFGWMTCAAALALTGGPGDGTAQEQAKDAPPGAKVIRDLEYGKAGDVKLLLDLYLPVEGDGPFPVIVAIHGGGWAAGKKEEAQGIRQAGRGYAVAAISYRLSGAAPFPAQLEDCKRAVRWLRANAQKYKLDPQRVGATGHSAGGYLASLLGTAGNAKEFDKGENLDFASRVQAVCALSGPTDFLQMDAHAIKNARLKHDHARSPESRLIGGPIQENKEKVAKANPITYVSKDSPPFLLIHGDADPVVPVHQAQLLRDALKQNGGPVQLHVVKGAGHGVGGRDVNEQVDRFFDSYLKNPAAKRSTTGEDAKDSPNGGDAPKPTSRVIPPVGLFVCRGPNPTPPQEVDFPFIDGWLVQPGWDRVEPKEGKYDWSYIDNEIALAKRLKKKITLCVLGGPQTPAWVYKAGAKEFDYTIPVGKAGNAKIPPLWDEVYLKKWLSLVRALGKKYDGDDTVVLVHITGATGNGLEMQIPFMPQDRERWQKLAYTPEKAVAAWKQIVSRFGESFPSKPIDIDIHPVLGSDQVAEEVAAYGCAKFDKRFGIFAGWLSGKSAEQDRHHAGMLTLAANYGPKGFAAFQMIASERRSPKQFAQGGLKTAIEQGLTWNAHYFEIWETDAMDPGLHPVLKDMAARLRK